MTRLVNSTLVLFKIAYDMNHFLIIKHITCFEYSYCSYFLRKRRLMTSGELGWREGSKPLGRNSAEKRVSEMVL